MTAAPVPVTEDTSLRLVCAVLAAHVSVLRERIDTTEEVILLWRATDVLADLAARVAELLEQVPPADPELAGRCAATIKSEAQIRAALDEKAFSQAQRQDLIRQMADCVVDALGRLAAPRSEGAPRLSPADLVAMYVSAEQLALHDQVSLEFGSV